MNKILFVSLFALSVIVKAEDIQKDISEIKVSIAEMRGDIKSQTKQFEMMQKNIEQLRADSQMQMADIRNLMYIIITAIIGLVGYITWDRKSTLSPFGKQLKESELEQSELKHKVKLLQEAFHEITELDPKLSKLKHKFPML